MYSRTNSGEPGGLCPHAISFLMSEVHPGQEKTDPENAPGLNSSPCVSGRMLNRPVKEMFWFSNPFLIFFLFPPPLFWEMRKIYKSKLLIKHLLCPWDRGPSVLFRWHVYCWHLSFLWVCTEPWNPFTFLIRLFLFFNLVQENRICNMHNTLKNCSIRGKAVPMFLAMCTSKRHDVEKNSTRGLGKVLAFWFSGYICLR